MATPTEMVMGEMLETIDRLKAENARLREALEQLSKAEAFIGKGWAEIAREALKGVE